MEVVAITKTATVVNRTIIATDFATIITTMDINMAATDFTVAAVVAAVD